MSFPMRETVSITTATGGGAVAYTANAWRGDVRAVIYTSATAAVAFASTVDFDIETEGTGLTVWKESNVTASKAVYPMAPAITSTGAASTVSERPIPLTHERLKFTLAQGGNTKSGSFVVVVG